VPESPSPLVAVIVVTWNGQEQLRRCLDALTRQTFHDFCTVVADNASTDGTAEMVQRDFPNVRLIRNPTNLGFAAANNLGIHATNTPLVVTLNNDTVPEPTWLAALVQPAQDDPALGSVASKMVSARDPESIDSCGIALDRAGIAWDRDGGYPATLVDRAREVFGPCAGAALYRRAMLEDVGLFDEDYFAYLEDVDLAWRARLRGWRCRLAPDAVVRHEHAGTLGDASPLKRYLLARNKVWTIAKCLPAADLWPWLPLILVYDVGAATFGVARQRDWASVRGRLAGLATLRGAQAKRQAIQARRTADPPEIARRYSPLALPWDVPRRYRHLVEPRVGAETRARLYLGGELASRRAVRPVRPADSARGADSALGGRPDVVGTQSPPLLDKSGVRPHPGGELASRRAGRPDSVGTQPLPLPEGEGTLAIVPPSRREADAGREAASERKADAQVASPSGRGWTGAARPGEGVPFNAAIAARMGGGAPSEPQRARVPLRSVLRRGTLRLLGSLLARSGQRQANTPQPSNAPAPSRPPRVLIMRPDHLGDVLLSRPALELVTRSMPDAEVTILAGPWGAASLQGLPAQIATFPFPGFTRAAKRSPLAPYGELLALAMRLRRERYDAALVLRPDHWWGALAAAVAGIPVRVGHRLPGVAPFLTQGVEPVTREPATKAALRAAEALVSALTRQPDAPADPSARFEPSPTGRRTARAWLAAARGGDRPTVAIHPGAGAAVKCWPAERWAQVIAAIPADVAVLLTGAGEEATRISAIQAGAARQVATALDLSWDALAALYEQVDLVVGMDSGPLHLATAVGTATVRIYGPTDPAIYGPAGLVEHDDVVQAALPCAPCGNLVAPPCGYLVDPPCLAAVDVAQVVHLIRARVAERAPV
jgi:GT2 family glycosyltransferase/ADP-heptose:LPS heptosyltransferase